MIIDENLFRKVIRSRPRHSHKGDYGRVLLVGGLYPYGGAIIMSALACVKSGAGLVTVATDHDNIAALHAQIAEVMAFDITDYRRLLEQVSAVTVILIGPGLSENAVTQLAFEDILKHIGDDQTLVIDGSALNILVKEKLSLNHVGQVILTSHEKEWERLSDLLISEQTSEATRLALKEFPKETILVAKSNATKIYQGDEQFSLAVGGPYQATGGMGDTLCGMIAGFLAQFRENLFETVAVATHLHSAIADELSQKSYVVLPTDISDALPKTMKILSDT